MLDLDLDLDPYLRDADDLVADLVLLRVPGIGRLWPTRPRGGPTRLRGGGSCGEDVHSDMSVAGGTTHAPSKGCLVITARSHVME